MKSINVIVQLTSICNWRCTVCAVSVLDDLVLENMPDDVFDKVLQDLKKFDNPRIQLGGYTGEPTLSPKFAEQVNTLKAHFPENVIGMHTNGSTLSKEMLQNVPEDMVILLSCLGGKSHYESFTGKTWEYFLNLCDILTTHHPLPFSNWVYITTNNQHNMSDTIKDLRQYTNLYGISNPLFGAPDFNEYQPYKNNIKYSDVNVSDSKNLEIISMRGNYIRANRGDLIDNPLYHKYKKIIPTFVVPDVNTTCITPATHIFVRTNGRVEMCCEYSDRKHVDMLHSNIMDHSLYEIFHSDEWNKLRTRLEKNIPGCQFCAVHCKRRFDPNIPKELYL